jgi:uncharacterized protein (TIGR03437 family)
LPGFVGLLSVQSIADSFPAVSPGYAPGSLFYIGLNRPQLIPGETDPPGKSVSSLAGYSFRANGTPVGLIAYQSGQFLAQLPEDTPAGSITLDAFDSSGARVSTANTTVTQVAPIFVADFLNPRARKSNGAVIDANNPVAPGDAVLVQVTGLGLADPLSAVGGPRRRLLRSDAPMRVIATICGKNARIISAQANESSPGVTDIWLTTPDLYDGDHYISVGAMGVSTSTRIPVKVKNP